MNLINLQNLSTVHTSPFHNEKYFHKINVKLFQNENTSSYFIQVKGGRVRLETFHGPYYKKLHTLFGNVIQKREHEFEDMKEIFGNAVARSNYGEQKPQTDIQIENRIEFNAKRAFTGNPFTGFAVIDNRTNKIIGFVSLEAGYEPGESQSVLTLNQDYQKKDYGKEVALLTGALAHIYFLNKFEVGPKNNKAIVKRFTATCADSNIPLINFVKKLGMHFMRPLSCLAVYFDKLSSLYGINSEDVEENLQKFLLLKNINWEVLKSSN